VSQDHALSVSDCGSRKHVRENLILGNPAEAVSPLLERSGRGFLWLWPSPWKGPADSGDVEVGLRQGERGVPQGGCIPQKFPDSSKWEL